MKLLLHLIPCVAIILDPAPTISEKPGESAEDASTQAHQAPILCYDTAERIAAMPPCKAEVEERFSCCLLMRTADGSKIWLGSPATTPEVLRFIPTLQDGQTYALPNAFLDWQKTPQQ
jgi:hypothetical protein